MASKHDNREWLTASKEGLRQLVADRGKAFIIGELLQNAWDEKGVTEVSVRLEGITGKSLARISIEDNAPEGWPKPNMEDAYTLFAVSKKKKDPTKRGRFNLGEKLVLAICKSAEITSMEWALVFDDKGRHASKKRTKVGSVFSGVIPLTRAEQKEIELYVETLIPPKGIITSFNRTNLEDREPKRVLSEKLPTMFEDELGRWKSTTRKTDVQVFEPLPGETPHIYEMGLPVVETDIKWHINVMQKVPLNMDRDNVPPSFHKILCTAVLNQMVGVLKDEDTSALWVQEATENPDIEDEVIEQYLDKRFGKKRVQFDPSDLEANKIAVVKGYTVVHGNSLSEDQRKNVNRAGALKPAGQVTPSPKAQFSSVGKDVTYPEDKWSEGMKEIVKFTEWLGGELLDCHVSVGVVNSTQGFGACWGEQRILFNVMKLSKKWFVGGVNDRVLRLVVHEFAHHYEDDHLSDEYHETLTRLGVQLAALVHRQPKRFKGVFE